MTKNFTPLYDYLIKVRGNLDLVCPTALINGCTADTSNHVMVQNFLNHIPSVEIDGVSYHVPWDFLYAQRELYISNHFPFNAERSSSLSDETHSVVSIPNRYSDDEFTVNVHNVIAGHHDTSNLIAQNGMSLGKGGPMSIPASSLVSSALRDWNEEDSHFKLTHPHPTIGEEIKSFRYRNYDGYSKRQDTSDLNKSNGELLIVFGMIPELDDFSQRRNIRYGMCPNMQNDAHVKYVERHGTITSTSMAAGIDMGFQFLTIKPNEEYLKAFVEHGGSVIKVDDTEVLMLVKNDVVYVPHCLYYGLNATVDMYIHILFDICGMMNDTTITSTPDYAAWDLHKIVPGTDIQLQSALEDNIKAIHDDITSSSREFANIAPRQRSWKYRIMGDEAAIREIENNLRGKSQNIDAAIERIGALPEVDKISIQDTNIAVLTHPLIGNVYDGNTHVYDIDIGVCAFIIDPIGNKIGVWSKNYSPYTCNKTDYVSDIVTMRTIMSAFNNLDILTIMRAIFGRYKRIAVSAVDETKAVKV